MCHCSVERRYLLYLACASVVLRFSYCTYDNMRPQSGHVADYLKADSLAASCHYGNLAILSGHHWQEVEENTDKENVMIRKLLQDGYFKSRHENPCSFWILLRFFNSCGTLSLYI